MKAGFILLEAIIATVIIAMVSLTALECVRMMSAATRKFAENSLIVQARHNGVALMQHLGRFADLKGGRGSIPYGPYVVQWQAVLIEAPSFQRFTLAGLSPPEVVPVYRVNVATILGSRTIDAFEIILAGGR